MSRHGQARPRHSRLPGHDTALGRGARRAGKRWGVGARGARAATLPGQGPRYGHCARLGAPVHAWVCLVGSDWVFCAPDSVFYPV